MKKYIVAAFLSFFVFAPISVIVIRGIVGGAAQAEAATETTINGPSILLSGTLQRYNESEAKVLFSLTLSNVPGGTICTIQKASTSGTAFVAVTKPCAEFVTSPVSTGFLSDATYTFKASVADGPVSSLEVPVVSSTSSTVVPAIPTPLLSPEERYLPWPSSDYDSASESQVSSLASSLVAVFDMKPIIGTKNTFPEGVNLNLWVDYEVWFYKCTITKTSTGGSGFINVTKECLNLGRNTPISVGALSPGEYSYKLVSTDGSGSTVNFSVVAEGGLKGTTILPGHAVRISPVVDALRFKLPNGEYNVYPVGSNLRLRLYERNSPTGGYCTIKKKSTGGTPFVERRVRCDSTKEVYTGPLSEGVYVYDVESEAGSKSATFSFRMTSDVPPPWMQLVTFSTDLSKNSLNMLAGDSGRNVLEAQYLPKDALCTVTRVLPIEPSFAPVTGLCEKFGYGNPIFFTFVEGVNQYMATSSTGLRVYGSKYKVGSRTVTGQSQFAGTSLALTARIDLTPKVLGQSKSGAFLSVAKNLPSGTSCTIRKTSTSGTAFATVTKPCENFVSAGLSTGPIVPGRYVYEVSEGYAGSKSSVTFDITESSLVIVPTDFTITTSSDTVIGSNPATSESGLAASISVVLTASPLAEVTLPVMSSDSTEGMVSVRYLTFTGANWNVPQTVTVRGVDDNLVDGNITYVVGVGPSTSSDAGFNGIAQKNAVFVNLDNEIAAVNPGNGGAGGSLGNGNNPSSNGSIELVAKKCPRGPSCTRGTDLCPAGSSGCEIPLGSSLNLSVFTTNIPAGTSCSVEKSSVGGTDFPIWTAPCSDMGSPKNTGPLAPGSYSYRAISGTGVSFNITFTVSAKPSLNIREI